MASNLMKRRLSRLCAVALAAATSFIAPALAANPLAITHVTIIDCTGAPPRPNMTVVVDRGRIVDVAAHPRIPTAAQRIDGRGKWLIPGLWDMHVHWYDKKTLSLFIANGVTGIRLMFGVAEHIAWRSGVEDGSILGRWFVNR